MRYSRAATLGTIGGLIWMAAALAGEPVAVVEDVSGKASGLEFMDYVDSGKVIKLEPRDRIVLDYLKSCWRETITGGTVTVGDEQSQVQFGKIERVRVKCDGGHMALSPEQSVESAGLISRSMREHPGDGQKISPQVMLYACTPIIDVRGGDTLLIERIDKQGERMELSIKPAQLVRGEFYDFASTNRVLTAGGVYRATLGAKQVVFKIDEAAPPMAPLGSRLLRF
jgi:preprotein translocase subunit Sec61beta